MVVDNCEQLIIENDGLVWHLLKTFPANEREDLHSIGVIGLMKAARSFNSEKSKFATYASRCILNEIRMELRKRKKSRSCQMSLDDIVFDDGQGGTAQWQDIVKDPNASFEDELAEQDEQSKRLALLRDELSKWSERDREILLMVGNGVTQIEIARRFGITRSYISRLTKKLLKKARRQVEKQEVTTVAKNRFDQSLPSSGTRRDPSDITSRRKVTVISSVQEARYSLVAEKTPTATSSSDTTLINTEDQRQNNRPSVREFSPPQAPIQSKGEKIIMTKEEYLAKRKEGLSRNAIAKELSIAFGTLQSRLDQWGLRDLETERAILGGKEPPVGPYVTIRIPIRAAALPETILPQELERSELVEAALRLAQAAIAKAYSDMEELIGASEAARHIQQYVDRHLGELVKSRLA